MTFPLPNADGDPGETEYCHGAGLMPSARQRATRNANFALVYPPGDAEGPWEPTPYERGKAIQRTDSALAGSTVEEGAAAFSNNNITGTQWVVEK